MLQICFQNSELHHQIIFCQAEHLQSLLERRVQLVNRDNVE